MEVILAHYYTRPEIQEAADFIWHWFLYTVAAQKLNQKNHRIEYYGYFHISISRF